MPKYVIYHAYIYDKTTYVTTVNCSNGKLKRKKRKRRIGNKNMSFNLDF
jgi:hypothetical protein